MNRTANAPTTNDDTAHVAITAEILKSSGFNVHTFNGGLLVSLKRTMHVMEVLRALYGEAPIGSMTFSRTIKGSVVIRFS